MTHTTMHSDRAGPLWAVFGAPLVGVPLMVALLALGSGTPVDTSVEADVGVKLEQVDLPQAESASQADVLPSG